MISRDKFAAIKLHFGELGNISYLRPNYAKAVADVVRELGGSPFLTDCNTLYPGSRKNALEHLQCAWENGFTPLTAGCPILIGDGLKGTDDIAVPVSGGEYVKEAKIGHAIMDADIFISLNHFKGHEMTGFGGAIKNIGMGCGSRAGKKDQHKVPVTYDASILPNLGMFASFDPLALDQACVDACMAANPLPGSQLYDNMQKPGFHDHHDHFTNSTPESEWRSCLEHAEKIGVGTREYELVMVK